MGEQINYGSTGSGEKVKASPALVAMAWIVVIVPAAWGITQTLKTSMKLFHQSAAATQTAR